MQRGALNLGSWRTLGILKPREDPKSRSPNSGLSYSYGVDL